MLTENQKISLQQFASRIKPKKVIMEKKEIISSEDDQATFSLNQKFIKLQELPITNWLNYRKTYANMIGYGFGILAWVISSNLFMLTKFDDISVGFKYYFRFPFEVFNNLSDLVESSTNGVSSDVWLQMIMIVCVSVGAYIAGWFIGNYFAGKTSKRPALFTLSKIGAN